MVSADKGFALSPRAKAAPIAELAGSAALGVALAALLWAVAKPVGPLPQPLDSTGGDAQSQALARAIDRLQATEDPFRRAMSNASAARADVSGFILHATRVAGQSGSAILSSSGAPQGAFGIGDEVAPGAKLVSVATDHVEIESGGERLRVSFPAAPPTLQTTTPGASVDPVAPDPSPPMNAAAVQPVSRQGASIGFEILPGPGAAAFESAGLRAGDIVLSVGGRDASPSSLGEQREKLLSGQQVEIRFERAGQIHTTSLGKH